MEVGILKNIKILILLFCCCLLGGCSKEPINGKVDGHWQLMTIEATDGSIQSCERIYYSIQLQLIEISHKKSDNQESFIGRFNYDSNTEKITVSDFRIRWQEETLVTQEQLLPYGIDRTETIFDVVKANSKILVLQSDYATLTFRSF